MSRRGAPGRENRSGLPIKISRSRWTSAPKWEWRRGNGRERQTRSTGDSYVAARRRPARNCHDNGECRFRMKVVKFNGVPTLQLVQHRTSQASVLSALLVRLEYQGKKYFCRAPERQRASERASQVILVNEAIFMFFHILPRDCISYEQWHGMESYEK